MLSDPNKSDEFKSSEQWDSDLLDFRVTIPRAEVDGGKGFKSNSFSGNERNRLIMNSGKGTFKDRSLVSGIDAKEDARSFVVFDYDGDGWLDIALASIQEPRLRLFRNQFGLLGEGGRVVDVVLRGGNTGAAADGDLSNRDAVGAVLTVVTREHTRQFRRSIGEGQAAQNSGKIRVVIAEGDQLQSLSVRWPSGKVTQIDPEPGQSQVEISE